jgi:hypothetical protein
VLPKCRKTLPFLPQHEQDKRNAACGCVYCLAARFVEKGKSKEAAMAEAEGIFAAFLRRPAVSLGLRARWGQ